MYLGYVGFSRVMFTKSARFSSFIFSLSLLIVIGASTYMFLFVRGGCRWPAEPDVGGIG